MCFPGEAMLAFKRCEKSFPKAGSQKQLYDSYIVEYCTRKKYLNDTRDKFSAFLD